MIAHGRSVTSGSEGHDPSELLRSRYINLIVAHSPFRNDPKLWKARKRLTGHRSCRHDPAIDVAQQFEYALFAECRVWCARRKSRENNIALMGLQKFNGPFIKKGRGGENCAAHGRGTFRFIEGFA